jgi:hypothetical protein
MTNFGTSNNRQEQRQADSAEVVLLTARCEEVFNSLVELRRHDPPAVLAQVGTKAVEFEQQNETPVTAPGQNEPSNVTDLQAYRLAQQRRNVEDIYREIAA